MTSSLNECSRHFSQFPTRYVPCSNHLHVQTFSCCRQHALNHINLWMEQPPLAWEVGTKAVTQRLPGLGSWHQSSHTETAWPGKLAPKQSHRDCLAWEVGTKAVTQRLPGLGSWHQSSHTETAWPGKLAPKQSQRLPGLGSWHQSSYTETAWPGKLAPKQLHWNQLAWNSVLPKSTLLLVAAFLFIIADHILFTCSKHLRNYSWFKSERGSFLFSFS